MYAFIVLLPVCFSLFQYGKWWVILLCSLLFLYQEVSGQQRVPCNEITADMGYTVQSVRIHGRWVPETLQKKVAQIIGVGQAFHPADVSAAIELVRTELVKGEENIAIPLAGATSALFITSDVCDVSDASHPKEVAVTIYPYYLRIDLYNLGNNILPVPRTAKPTFYEKVPIALLATAPILGLMNDRRYGTSLSLKTTTDLLNLPTHFKQDHTFKKIKLNLRLNARISVTDPFHDLGAGLDLAQPVYSPSGLGWKLGVDYAQNNQPLAKGEYDQELTRISGEVQKKGKTAFLNRYVLGGGVNFLQNTYAVLPVSQKMQYPENDFHIYVLNDGRIGVGFSRVGIWFNAGNPKSSIDYQSYQQVAGRIGYAVTLGRGHNNFNIESVLGGGHTWGSAPPYHQFFAGNTSWNFLYEPVSSARLTTFPVGAVVRSLGEREGGLQSTTTTVLGGNSYWHLNFNFSVPVATWARPLIPDMVVSETPRRSTLADKLKGAVNLSQSWIAQDLIDTHGLPDNETTDSLAEAIVNRDIRPTITYLADKADVYAIKPMLLLDVAGISSRNSGSKTFCAAGVGVQLTVVNARLETGYVHTLFPALYSGKGNFILRFVLQNFY